jgi:hypothetical protein
MRLVWGGPMGHCPPIDFGDDFDELEEMFSGDPAIFMPKLEDAIIAINSGRPLTDIAAERRDGDRAEHLERHWFNEWWPEQQPVEPILQQGLIEALTKARDLELPLQALMVTGQLDDFQVAVVEGRSQVTMIVIAPLPPPDTVGRRSPRITLIRREETEIVVD